MAVTTRAYHWIVGLFLLLFTGCWAQCGTSGFSDKPLQLVLSSAYRSVVIQSPNFPDKYPPNSNCQWNITTMGGMVIRVHIQEMELEMSQGCRFDNLTLYDGGGPSSPVMSLLCPNDHQQVRSLCSSGPSLFLAFRTDGGYGFSGFRARVDPLPLHQASGNHTVCNQLGAMTTTRSTATSSSGSAHTVTHAQLPPSASRSSSPSLSTVITPTRKRPLSSSTTLVAPDTKGTAVIVGGLVGGILVMCVAFCVCCCLCCLCLKRSAPKHQEHPTRAMSNEARAHLTRTLSRAASLATGSTVRCPIPRTRSSLRRSLQARSGDSLVITVSTLRGHEGTVSWSPQPGPGHASNVIPQAPPPYPGLTESDTPEAPPIVAPPSLEDAPPSYSVATGISDIAVSLDDCDQAPPPYWAQVGDSISGNSQA